MVHSQLEQHQLKVRNQLAHLQQGQHQPMEQADTINPKVHEAMKSSQDSSSNTTNNTTTTNTTTDSSTTTK